MNQWRYKAFLSYSHRDERWAQWLHRSLEAYRPPKALIGQSTERGIIPKRLTPVFRDREELPSATNLGSVIAAALEQSACQIVICSPRSARSRWVNEEILSFKRLGREERIFCLIVDGEPNASDDPQQAENECFPPAVRYRMGAQGELSDERTEPIAADAREGKDGKANARLKLIAGMLGVGFDSLKQREQHRRNRRLAMAATAAFSGMLLTTGLAAAALIARESAERERIRAESEAETARQTTAFMVDLFRVADPSEARGNTITAREVLDKGAGRIQAELAGQPAIQATLMDTLGTVYKSLGLYPQAKPLLDGALARRQHMLDSADPQLSASMNHVGELLNLQASFAKAERTYRQALAAQQARAQLPDALTAQSLTGLAAALSGQSRFEEAEADLRKALRIQQSPPAAAPGDIARTLEDLAIVVYRRGNLKAAIPLMERAVALQRKIRGTLPHPDLAEALNNLMYLMHAAGQYAQAEELLLESLDMKRRLLGDKHPEIALGLNNLASFRQDRGDYAGAEAAYRQALAMQRELLGNVHPDVAQTLSNLASLLYDEGNPGAALRTEREALAILRQLFPSDNQEVALALNTMGYWLMQQGDYAQAQRSIGEALATRRRLFGDNHAQMASSLTHLAMLQVARHRYADALASARDATRIFNANLPPGQWRTAVAQSAEGAALAGLGKLEEAEKILLKSYADLSRDRGAWPMYRRQTLQYLQQLYVRLNRPEEARHFAQLAPGRNVPDDVH